MTEVPRLPDCKLQPILAFTKTPFCQAHQQSGAVRDVLASTSKHSCVPSVSMREPILTTAWNKREVDKIRC